MQNPLNRDQTEGGAGGGGGGVGGGGGAGGGGRQQDTAHAGAQLPGHPGGHGLALLLYG